MNALTDEQLIQLSRDGNGGAFAVLWRRHEALLRALVLREVRCAADADDVLQQIAFDGWRHIAALRSGEQLRPWLVQIARRRCWDFHRARRRGILLENTDTADHIAPAQRDPRWYETTGEDIPGALEAIPEMQRDTARQYYLEGMSIAEIARQLNAPQGTVKRRLHDARRSLRTHFGILEKPQVSQNTEKDITMDLISAREIPAQPCTSLAEALVQLHAWLSARGAGRWVPMLGVEEVVEAVRTGMASYLAVEQTNSERVQRYVHETIDPLVAKVTAERQWPPEAKFDIGLERKGSFGISYRGLGVGIEFWTPGQPCAGFSLPILDGWYGKYE